MSEHENLAVIEDWVDAINRNDVDAEIACWRPDGEYIVVPTGSVYKGIAQIRQAGQQSAAAVAGQPAQGRKQITHLEAGEEWACVSYDTHATIGGPLVVDGVTIIPTRCDRTVSTKACVVFEMAQGKISRATEYFDLLAMARQLGLDDTLAERLYSSLGSHTESSSSGAAGTTPVDVVVRFFEAWNTKNLHDLTALLAPEVSGRNPLSDAEITLSKDAVRSAIGRNMAAFPDLHMEIKNIVAQDCVVAVQEIETATLAATKKSYSMPVAWLPASRRGRADLRHSQLLGYRHVLPAAAHHTLRACSYPRE